MTKFDKLYESIMMEKETRIDGKKVYITNVPGGVKKLFKKDGTLITTFDFDRGSDSFWVKNPNGKGDLSYDSFQDIIKHYDKITK